MMRYFGSIVGAGVLAGVLNTDSVDPSVAVFRAIYILLAAMAVLAFLVALQIHRFRDEEDEQPTRHEAQPACAPAGS